MMPWKHLQILADASYQNMKRLLVIWYLNCPDSVNNGSFFIIFLKIFRFIPLHLFHWLKLRKFRYFNDKIILFLITALTFLSLSAIATVFVLMCSDAHLMLLWLKLCGLSCNICISPPKNCQNFKSS